MIRPHLMLFLLCSFFTSLLSAADADSTAKPVKLIFDTDMGNDVDDALALGLIHTLMSRGDCELLAVTSTKTHPASIEFIDAINTFYGRGEIPLGIVKNGVTPAEGKFNKLARLTEGPEGAKRFPHDTDGKSAPEATGILRKVLAEQPDGSVVMVQVGFSSNFARLLKSKPDEHSRLDGIALVQKKVRLLSIMAGYFRMRPGKNNFGEYNVKNDLPATRLLVERWPTPIIWSGWEIGDAIRYPAVSIEHDYDYVDHHPLPEAYQLYLPTPHERPTWDLTSVLYAVFPGRGYFTLSEPGRVSIDDTGRTTFTPTESGTSRYLIVSSEQAARVREAFVWLCSQPPARLLKD